MPTRWTLVVAAAENDSQSGQALETLCRSYWRPLYAFVRRQGHSPHDAEDLTQEFFARLLAKNYIKTADREKGRFRSFLLVALKHFLANEWDRAQTLKRGGACAHLPLDTTAVETHFQSIAVATPEKAFDRQWAVTLLDETMAQLKHEFSAAGKSVEFDALKGFLTAEKNAIRYADAAEALGMSEGAVRVTIHRMRKRFREIFREEIAQTVASPDEIDAEIRHLMSVLAE